MPVLSLEVDYQGRPTVELYVTIGTTEAALRRGDGIDLPGFLRVVALVDTGASQSQIDLAVLEDLGLYPVSEVELFTASTGREPELMKVFEVDLSIAGNQPGPFAEDLRVVGSSKLAGLRVGMLLGRDVLDGGLLCHDGPNRRSSFAFDRPGSRTADERA